MSVYQYTECGLTNVFIENMQVLTDDAGEKVYRIANINGLHKVIAQSIVQHPHSISAAELRFLRTEMGLTQAELAGFLHKEPLTVGRWERGQTPQIDSSDEALIRLLAIQKLELPTDLSVQELMQACVPTAQMQRIRIDGADPTNYRLMAEAA